MGGWPLCFGRAPLKQPNRRNTQSCRAAHQRVSQRLSRNIPIDGHQRMLQQFTLVHRQRGIPSPDGGLIHFSDHHREHIRDGDGAIAHCNLKSVGARSLTFRWSPAHQPIGSHHQTGRPFHQSVTQSLARIIQIIGHQCPNHLLTFSSDRRRIRKPNRRLIVFGDLNLESHATGQPTIGYLGHHVPTGSSQTLTRLPSPLPRRAHSKTRRTLNERPHQGSTQIRIRRAQITNRPNILRHRDIGDQDHEGIGSAVGHRDGASFLDRGDPITDLHHKSVGARNIRSLRGPLQKPAYRNGEPTRRLQQAVGQRLKRQVRIHCRDHFLQGLGFDRHQFGEGIKHRRIVQDRRRHNGHIAQPVIRHRGTNNRPTDRYQRLLGSHQGIRKSHFRHLQGERVTRSHPLQFPGDNGRQSRSVESLVLHRHDTRHGLGPDFQGS